MIIGSAAHFVVCACGGHGRLIAVNGKKTRHLCSKEQAKRALDAGVEHGFITKEEIPEALRQIDVSSIPERDKEVPLAMQLVARLNDYVDWFDSSVEIPDPHDLRFLGGADGRVH